MKALAIALNCALSYALARTAQIPTDAAKERGEKIMKKLLTILIAVGMVGFSAGVAPAALSVPVINETANSDVYPVKVTGQLLRGVVTIGTSPIEVLSHTMTSMKEKPILGILPGLKDGLFHTGNDMVKGALDIVTSPLPGNSGYPHDHELKILG